MDLKRFISCLNSDARRRILQLLSEKDMSAPQIYRELGKYAPKYRQSVNKSLEMLREAGLVSKHYDNENKAIYFHLVKKTYIFEISKMKVE
jgi:Fe2+ or Zn2+ uptake regulation protein